MKRLRTILLLCGAIAGPAVLLTPASAADQPVEVEVTGEARLGEADTPREVKDRARHDAQTMALEAAVGTFMMSHTLVSNNQVADDLVYASVRGSLERCETLSEGWDQKDRTLYRIRMKAWVTPVYPEKGEGLSLRVSLSKSVLKAGEEVSILYETSADAYVYIFSVAADGSVTLLLPNSDRMNNFVPARTAGVFPPAGSTLRLQAELLPGTAGPAEEKVKLIATRKKEDLVSLGFREGKFQVWDARSTGMISDLVRRLNQLEPGSWAEATAVYRIVR